MIVDIGPGSQSSLREANTARVINAVQKYGPITQVEISAATGLSPASVSNTVKRLAAEGFFKTENTIRSGRRAQLVSIPRQSGLLAGISIGHRSLTVAVATTSFEILQVKNLPLPVDHRPDTTLDRAALLTHDLVSAVGVPDDLAGVGITVPAPVDPATGKVPVKGIFPGWEGIDIAGALSRRLDRPAAIENDANAGALAESKLGALRGVTNGIFLRASYSTGAGIMFSDRILHGAGGTAGEIGHVQVDPTGLICRCGARGCLNTVVGADVLVESLRLSRGYSSLSDVIREANSGDAGCRQVIADAGASIGVAVADLATNFAPSVVVVGGELATTGDLILDPIRDALDSRPLLAGSVAVRLADLAPQAELYGALVKARDIIGTAPPGTPPRGAPTGTTTRRKEA